MNEHSQPVEQLRRRCCVVGGGPAGMMLGFLLARDGVEVIVLEKHKDFLRDFRGDTIHPSTLELMHELGLLEEFLQSAASTAPPDPSALRLGEDNDRGFFTPADALQVHRLHAPVGFFELHFRACASLRVVFSANGSRGDRLTFRK